MMRYFSFLTSTILLTSLLVTGCQKEREKIDVSGIPSDVVIVRFDREYAEVTPETFPVLKAKYPLFFPVDQPDSVWINRKNDSLFRQLYDESQKVFGNFDNQKKELDALFKHVKYYYPQFKEPKVYTLISELDYDYQVILADSVLTLSLDTYLGKSKMYYADFPSYLQTKFDPERIPVDVAAAIAYQVNPQISYRVFVERIVALGKQKYTMMQFLPNKSEAEIVGYTDKQIRWTEENAYYMWQYFMEKEYLYSTDKDLERRFIDPAPFSKFYMEKDTDSPGQVGIWLGLQIVKSYMEYNEVPLTKMIITPPMDIFNKSKYKPTK